MNIYKNILFLQSFFKLFFHDISIVLVAPFQIFYAVLSLNLRDVIPFMVQTMRAKMSELRKYSLTVHVRFRDGAWEWAVEDYYKEMFRIQNLLNTIDWKGMSNFFTHIFAHDHHYRYLRIDVDARGTYTLTLDKGSGNFVLIMPFSKANENARFSHRLIKYLQTHGFTQEKSGSVILHMHKYQLIWDDQISLLAIQCGNDRKTAVKICHDVWKNMWRTNQRPVLRLW